VIGIESLLRGSDAACYDQVCVTSGPFGPFPPYSVGVPCCSIPTNPVFNSVSKLPSVPKWRKASYRRYMTGASSRAIGGLEMLLVEVIGIEPMSEKACVQTTTSVVPGKFNLSDIPGTESQLGDLSMVFCRCPTTEAQQQLMWWSSFCPISKTDDGQADLIKQLGLQEILAEQESQTVLD